MWFPVPLPHDIWSLSAFNGMRAILVTYSEHFSAGVESILLFTIQMV